MISDLIKEVFTQASQEPGLSNKMTPLAEYISNWVAENRSPTTMSYKTISAHYKTYIKPHENASNIESENEEKISLEYLNAYAAFIGYIDYNDYVQKVSSSRQGEYHAYTVDEIEPNPTPASNSNTINIDKNLHHVENNKEKNVTNISGDQININKDGGKENKKRIGIILALLIFIAVVVVLVLNLVKDNDKPKCMVWNETRYELLNCDESKNNNNSISLQGLEWEKKYKDFKRINLTTSTALFDRNGNPLVYYTLINGQYEFFNNPGSHPISGKTLNPVSQSVRDRYLNAKSDLEHFEHQDNQLSQQDDQELFGSTDIMNETKPKNLTGRYCFANQSEASINVLISSIKGIRKNVAINSSEQVCVTLPIGTYSYRAFTTNSVVSFKAGTFSINNEIQGSLYLKPHSKKDGQTAFSGEPISITQPEKIQKNKNCKKGDFKVINKSNQKIEITVSESSTLSRFYRKLHLKPGKSGFLYDFEVASLNVSLVRGTDFAYPEFSQIKIKGCEVVEMIVD